MQQASGLKSAKTLGLCLPLLTLTTLQTQILWQPPWQHRLQVAALMALRPGRSLKRRPNWAQRHKRGPNNPPQEEEALVRALDSCDADLDGQAGLQRVQLLVIYVLVIYVLVIRVLLEQRRVCRRQPGRRAAAVGRPRSACIAAHA